MGNGSALAGFLLLFGVMSASPTSAQPPSATGAYERMSPGNQKVAQALFDAQTAALPARGASVRAARRLTLDEIAAQKHAGQGWGQVFQLMRSQGLVHETSLGQVVTRYEHPRSSAVLTPASRGKDGARITQEAVQR